jgi:hypothetical protein
LKVTVYPDADVYDEILRLGKKLGGRTVTDCLRIMLDLGVETARRSALKPDRLETAALETHDIVTTALAYLMEVTAHLDVPIDKTGLDQRKTAIINRVKRRI